MILHLAIVDYEGVYLLIRDVLGQLQVFADGGGLVLADVLANEVEGIACECDG